jgi:ankyrin repeat protein
LAAAAFDGREDIIRILIEAGADVNLKSGAFGQTPLFFAVQNNHVEAVRFLIESGANVDIWDDSGGTPLSHAIVRGHTGIAHLLRQSGAQTLEVEMPADNADIHSLLRRVQENHLNIVRDLIERGVNVNEMPEGLITPLMSSAHHGYVDITRLLLNNGAEVSIREERLGWTALFFAVKYNHPGVVHLLIEAGADVNIKDKDGFTPLMRSIGRHHTEVAQLLKDAGARE